MPRYKKDSPLIEDDIRILAGGACRVEITSLAIEKWQRDNPNDDFWQNITLEKHINKRGKDFLSYSTGCYDKMLSDGPPNILLKLLEEIFSTKSVTKWRDHYLFGLLSRCEDKSTYINFALEKTQGEIRDYIWEWYPPGKDMKELSRIEVDEVKIEKIAEFKNFDALMVLTAFAVEADKRQMAKTYYLCGLHSRKIFSYVICHSPHLFINWRLLAKKYMDTIWKNPSGVPAISKWFDLSMNNIEKEIFNAENLAMRNGIFLPPEILVNKLDKKNPFYWETRYLQN